MASNTSKNKSSKTIKNKKSGTRKTTASKRSTSRKKVQNEQSFLSKEITIWVSLALCILLMISNLGVGGLIGDAVGGIMQYLFGWVAYLFPIVLFAIIAFVCSNQGNYVAYVKAGAVAVFMIFLCVILQLVSNRGGITGEGIVSVLSTAIGVAGTWVVACVIMLICTVMVTERSILGSVKSKSEKVYGRAREDVQRHREDMQERKQMQREQLEQTRSQKRMDHSVTGVSFDTTLKPVEKKEEVKKKEDKNVPIVAVEEKVNPIDEVVINRSMPLSATELAPAPETLEEPKTVRKKETLAKEELQKETAALEQVIAETKVQKEYIFPPLTLLKRGAKTGGDSDAHLRETAMKLQKTLQTFGVNVTVTNISCGPAVTRYELQPEMGVKVSKIVGLADDIKLNLAASDIRIEAPIPGKAAVGIEVPNKENTMVMLRDLLESSEFKKSVSKISFATGRDIGGKVVVSDIAKMPHLLVAGATGSGKSVCINTIIMSIIYKARPDEVKLIMIDPKVVELSVYNGIPHLMIPVVTDPKKAAGALNWAVTEMNKRYQLFAEYGVRDLKGFNAKVENLPDAPDKPQKMPQIVIIVDELADLMMVAPGDVEEAICRLAQLARAAGLNLVLATQRPSVDVITGLIKANMPSRIAFSVSSGVDSRTIIDMNGAEKLLGKGDMLFYPAGYQKPARVQGSFVTDSEVQEVVDYLIKQNGDATYNDEVVQQVNTCQSGGLTSASASEDDGRDVYFTEAGRLIIEKEKASIGMLQRAFKIGFNRAARIMDQLFEAGVVGPEEGTKPRKVLMTSEEFEQYTNQQSGRRNSEDEM